MPFIAAWVASAVATAAAVTTTAALAIGASTAVAGAVFTLTTWGLYAGIAYGASRVLNKQPKLPTFITDATDRTQMVRQAAASRKIVYGKVKTSGPLVFVHATGSANEYLHMVILLATHEIEEISEVYLNDELLTFSGTTGGAATGKYAGFVRVNFKYGGAGQTADSDLVAETGGTWTSDDKLGDIAYIYVRLKYDAKLFTSGLPNFSAVVKGRKIYDPRTGLTGYSNNAALCLYDYMTDAKFGLGVLSSEINTAAIIAAANVCDESVSLAAGGSELRYTLNGTIDTAQTPQSVIEAMLSAMSGRAIYAGGQWFIKAGAYSIPTVTLTESDLRGPITVQTKLSRRELSNGVKGVFVSPESAWQPVDFPPQLGTVAAGSLVAGLKYTIQTVGTSDFTIAGASSNAVGVTFTATGTTTGTGLADLYQGQDNGERLWKDIQLPFTTSAATAQRLARIDLERSRRQITCSLQCKLTALTVQAGENIMVTNTRLGWSAKVFEVSSFAFASYSDGEGNPAIGVDLVLRETDGNVWAWSGNDVTLPAAATTNLPNPYSVSAPTSPTLSLVGFRQPDGSYVPQLKVSWTAPAEQTVQSGGLVRIQYKKHADSDWTEWGTVKGDQVFDVIAITLLMGTAYDVQIRAENSLGVPSAWVQSLNYTVPLDAGTAAVPTAITYTAGNASTYGEPPIVGTNGFKLCCKVEWGLTTDANIVGYEWTTSTTDSDAAATSAMNPVGPGYVSAQLVTTRKAIVAFDILLGSAYFRVRSVNSAGVRSDWAGGGTDINASLMQRPAVLGTASTQAAAGNDSRITGAAQKASNLSDIASASTARSNLGLGTLATQNASAAQLTGLQVGNGSSVLQLKAIYSTNEVVTLSGGATSEVVSINITNRGFSTAPTSGVVVVEDVLYAGFYESTNGSNSSTAAKIRIYRNDGGTLGSGNLRLSAVFAQH